MTQAVSLQTLTSSVPSASPVRQQLLSCRQVQPSLSPALKSPATCLNTFFASETVLGSEAKVSHEVILIPFIAIDGRDGHRRCSAFPLASLALLLASLKVGFSPSPLSCHEGIRWSHWPALKRIRIRVSATINAAVSSFRPSIYSSQRCQLDGLYPVFDSVHPNPSATQARPGSYSVSSEPSTSWK